MFATTHTEREREYSYEIQIKPYSSSSTKKLNNWQLGTWWLHNANEDECFAETSQVMQIQGNRMEHFDFVADDARI